MLCLGTHTLGFGLAGDQGGNLSQGHKFIHSTYLLLYGIQDSLCFSGELRNIVPGWFLTGLSEQVSDDMVLTLMLMAVHLCGLGFSVLQLCLSICVLEVCGASAWESTR